jgi:sterol desaturase/sphingolipid hydroxylase (fatty acid hydroxylase superfamily)
VNRFVTIFSWTIFPLTLGGAIAVSIVQMLGGAPPAAATFLPIVTAYLLVLTLERVLPLHAEWQHSRGDLRVDVGHFLVSGLLTLGLLRPTVVAGSIVVAGWLSSAVGTGLWPGGLDLVSQLVLALIVGEFFMYWAHRLGHEWEWLWRFHSIHHSAPRLYFLNAVRFHPDDIAISTFAPMIPLIILGAGEPVLALFALVSAVHGIFQHANLPIHCGPLNWFFSMAELHRWHHSRQLDEANTNYGQNLIVWDVVFGTRFLPSDREPPIDIGISDMPGFPMGYVAQLLVPFRWSRIKREAEALRTDEAQRAA